MKIIVFGKTGQVAQELARHCPAGLEAIFLGREQANLSNPTACAAVIESVEADAVINAAAWTAVDLAESAEAEANTVNAQAPAAMARACAARRLPLLHISTDYVFNGSGTAPFRPDDIPAPINAYGRSKLGGELGIRESGARHLILRTSWVFSSHGQNFVKTMLRLGRERTNLRVVADQIGAPTPASAIAKALFAAAGLLHEGRAGGTYHFAGRPDASWADLADAVTKSANLPCRIEDIASDQYPTAAKRPLNSRLDCSSFLRDFGIPRPDWERELDDVLTELGARK